MYLTFAASMTSLDLTVTCSVCGVATALTTRVLRAPRTLLFAASTVEEAIAAFIEIAIVFGSGVPVWEFCGSGKENQLRQLFIFWEELVAHIKIHSLCSIMLALEARVSDS